MGGGGLLPVGCGCSRQRESSCSCSVAWRTTSTCRKSIDGEAYTRIDTGKEKRHREVAL